MGEKAPGPSPTFSSVHVIKALELIAKESIGRNKLSKDLALGGGATRTLIERLKDNGVITIEKKGCVLSKKGEKLWKSIHAIFPRKIVLGKSGLTLAEANVALVVKGRGEKVRFGMEQRDAAVMVGARGATTLVFKSGRLKVPPDQRDIAEDSPQVYRELVESLKPEEDDVVVIGSADSVTRAEYGALAAALILLDDGDVS